MGLAPVPFMRSRRSFVNLFFISGTAYSTYARFIYIFHVCVRSINMYVRVLNVP